VMIQGYLSGVQTDRDCHAPFGRSQ
jgi:hypothetical protein